MNTIITRGLGVDTKLVSQGYGLEGFADMFAPHYVSVRESYELDLFASLLVDYVKDINIFSPLLKCNEFSFNIKRAFLNKHQEQLQLKAILNHNKLKNLINKI